MRLRAACVLAVLALAAPCFSQNLDTLLSEGRKAFLEGRYSVAATAYRQVTQASVSSPQAEEAGYMLGLSLLRSGDWDDSLAAFAGFRSRFPGSRFMRRVPYWMAAANVKLGHFETSLALLAPLATRRDEGAKDSFRASSTLLTGIAQEASGKNQEATASYRSLLGQTPPNPLQPEATFRLAGMEYRAGRFASSRDLYGRIILDSPRSPFVRDSLYFLAQSEMALGDYEDAERRYHTLLSLYPDSPYRQSAALRIAEAAWRQGSTVRALAMLEDEMRQFSEGAARGTALHLRGDFHLSRQEYEQAVADYEAALGVLKDGPEWRSAMYAMGVSELGLKRPEAAMESFGRVTEGPPGEVTERAGYQHALLLANAGDRLKAEQALDSFLAGFPDSPRAEQARRLLAELLQQSGDMPGALKQWDLLVERHGGSAASAEYLFKRGAVLLDLDQTARAFDDFQGLLKLYPGSAWSAEASYSIGYLYTRRGEYPRALPYFQAAARTASPGEIVERSLLSAAICLFDMGSFDRALAALQDLRNQAPRSVSEGRVVLYMGKALYRMGKLESAAQRLREATGLLSSELSHDASAGAGSEAWYWLAWSLLRLGSVEAARDAFLALAAGYPQDMRRVEALFRAGICETMSKDDASAVRMFDQAIAGSHGAADAGIREQALYERGWALARLGWAEESADAFDMLEREYPAGRLAPEAFFKKADGALQDGRFKDARAGFERVVRDFPHSPLAVRALYWSAEAARRDGDLRGALDGYWACLQAGPEQGILSSALDGFRAAILSVDDMEAAKSYADRAKEAKGFPIEAAAALQLDYAKLLLASSPAEARRVIGGVVASAPPEPMAGEAGLLLGMCDAAEGNWNKAIVVFQSLERSRTDEVGARAMVQYASALEAMGLTAEAVDQYLQVLLRFPDLPNVDAEALFNAARISWGRGDAEKGAALEQELRARYAGSPWIARLQQH
jgi:TolA-binding protein